MSQSLSDFEESLPVSSEMKMEALLSSNLLEALPDAIVAVNPEGTILQVNTQALELFGYSRQELIGQKVEILVPDSYRGQHNHHRETFAKNPKTRRMGRISISTVDGATVRSFPWKSASARFRQRPECSY